MKKVYVALITPFTKENEIDYKYLEKLIHRLIDEGCDGFIVCGTTGEASTLSEEEKFDLLTFVLAVCKQHVEVYFGCGNNNTADTLRLCRKAQNYDIDGILIVTPYYNKPSQEGLYQHYASIASNCTLPIIMYQVESRCNCVFEIETLQRLVKNFTNIIALKYASKNIGKAKEIKQKMPRLKLLNGDDSLILEGDKAGMDGIVSVIGHIAMKELIAFYKEEMILYDYYFKRLCHLLFIESNPTPIKYALHKLEGGNENLRLPLVTLDDKNKTLLDAYFDKK